MDLWLIHRCRRGDPDAFAALYEAHRRTAYRTALYLVHDPALAEEILQEAFVTVFEQIGTLRSPGAFRTWLYRVVVSRATRALRSEGGRRRPLSLDAMAEQHLPVAPDPEESAADSEEIALLRNAIRYLDDDLRLTVTLHYFSGLSTAEVGAVLGIPAGTVKSRLHTARRRLAELLDADQPAAVRQPREMNI